METSTRNVLRLSNVGRMGLLWTLLLIFSYIRLLLQRICGGSASSFPRIHLRSHQFACIVTGASCGIGKATAEILACEGYHVILAGRSYARLSKVVEEIKRHHRGVSLQAVELDLASIPSILKFVEAIKEYLQETQRTLQLLVNNAGILAASERWTLDGYECMMATNFLGPFMLTRLLLPIMEKSLTPARIVNVVSFTHRCVTNLHVDAAKLMEGEIQNYTMKSKWYGMARIYEASKLCLLLFTYELHRQLGMNKLPSQVTVMAADPGAVQTCILRELPNWLTWISHTILRILGLLNSPKQGAKTVVDAVLASSELSGLYFFGGNGRTLKSSSLSYNLELAKKLWSCASALCDRAIACHTFVSNPD